MAKRILTLSSILFVLSKWSDLVVGGVDKILLFLWSNLMNFFRTKAQKKASKGLGQEASVVLGHPTVNVQNFTDSQLSLG